MAHLHGEGPLSGHDAPTVRAEDAGSSPPTAVEQVLTAYVFAVESGEKPSLQHFLGMLPSESLREQFLDLIDQLAFADHNLPLRLRPRLVIGGRYELLESIGSGGMGQVWRALDRKLEHEVAVKVLSLAATAALDLDHLMEREGKLLAKLSHPGIVRIQDTGRDGEHRYLVMELIGGQALDDLIEQVRERRDQRKLAIGAKDLIELVGPVSPGRTAVLRGDESWDGAATKVVVSLLRILEAAHGAGVVHRDLKPANVRLIGGGSPVLLDFGISIATNAVSGTMTTAMFGTAQYSAPEQWDGSAVPGVRTDVYQAGLVLYELLTLHRCFRSSSPIETMQAVKGAKYPHPRQLVRSIDRSLEACVLRAMEVDPAHRYPSATAFREDLECHLAGDVPRAAQGRAMVARRTRAFWRRHRGHATLAAAALIGASGFWLLRGEPALAVSPVAGSPWAWSADARAPGSMALSAMVRDQDGVERFAPMRVGVGPAPTRGKVAAVEFGAGTTRIEIAPVGDVPLGPSGEIVFRPVCSTSGDERSARDMVAWVGALDEARKLIESRNGEWLSREEWDGLFRQGKGAGSIEATQAQLFGDAEWRAGGLSGFVVRQQLPTK